MNDGTNLIRRAEKIKKEKKRKENSVNTEKLLFYFN